MASMSIGKKGDQLYNLIQKQVVARKEVKELGKKIDKCKGELMHMFEKQDVTSTRGSVATAFIVRRKHVKIGDYNKFIRFVKKYEAYDLFQKRVSKEAYMDRLEEGDKVPGVKVFTEVDINTRKKPT